MTTTVMYSQCKLRKNDTLQVSWIPVKFAKIGRTVDLREDDGTWSDGWEVVETDPFKLSISEINERSNDHKNMRKVTDI